MRVIPFILLTTFSHFVIAQEEEIENVLVESSKEGEWQGIPGMSGNGIALMNQTGFLVLMGSALSSYFLTEFVFKDTNRNYFQTRFGLYGGSNKTIISFQTFGIEKRVSHWFGVGLEVNFQQWAGQLPVRHNGTGVGLNTYYRWHLFGKRKFSPFLEYGARVFQGFKPLPFEGSRFTFHLSTSLGAEYTFDNNNKLRFSYGRLHQSNNDLLQVNPGLDESGFQATFLWFWK